MRIIKRDDETVDSARVALLLGLSIGLGITVHEVFFLVGGAIALCRADRCHSAYAPKTCRAGAASASTSLGI
jgi:hypothetical protein